MSDIRSILGLIIRDYREIKSCMVVTQSPNKQKRTSNKSKLKQTKSKPNNKYKSSKPLKSKSLTQFRNKSNI
jgi:hypothetical protein